MQVWVFPASIKQFGKDDFVITFADFPEAISGGATLGEARLNGADALKQVVLLYLSLGIMVPTPHAHAIHDELIVLDPPTAACAVLANAMGEKGITPAVLAKVLGKSERVVRRLIDGSGAAKLDAVLQAMTAIGARAALAVTVE